MVAMLDTAAPLALASAGVAAIVWGAESFAEHLARAAARLGVTTFALALLLAGAEPEELATAVTGTLRKAPAIAFGDVAGANLTIALVALGVGAIVAPIPFGPRVRRYALLSLPVGALAAGLAWDGHVSRVEGAVLVSLYASYVGAIWLAERSPPALGETAEIEEALEAPPRRVGKELALVLAGLAAMVVGATLLVDGVRELVETEADQARVSLTVVGFATGFELVVLAWSSARRGISEAVVAGVVGSYAYNATMTLGAAALARPLRLVDADVLHGPLVAMVGAPVGVLALAARRRALAQRDGVVLLLAYLAFVALVAASG